MKYFVTGGTGFIGTNVVKQLIEEGHDVIATTRSRANASHLPDEVEVVEADITDKESLREPMTAVDGVFHMAAWFYIGPGPRNREKAERINVEGTRNVLELIDELDIPKGVYTSTIAVFGDTNGRVVDETHHPDDPGLCVYFHTKWRAHYDVAKPMMEDGLPLVVVQPGGVFGPGDKPYGSVRAPFFDWFQGDLPMLSRQFTLPFDYVEDTAHAHLLAMENGEPGEEYIIASEPRGVIDIFEQAAEMTGISPPRAVSPLWFQLLTKLLQPVEWMTTPPDGFEPEIFRTYGGTEILVDNSKAREELGIEHRPFEEGLREYLEWEANQHDIDTELAERTSQNAATDTVS
jgi:dihydroflavonol-4-reductase